MDSERRSYSENPFASPTSVPVPASPHEGLSPSEVRELHYDHESAIRFGGVVLLTLSLLPAIVLCIVLSAMVFDYPSRGGEPILFFGFLATLYAFFMALFIWCGIGWRRLDPWARRIMVFVSWLLVLVIPIGTVIGCYFLWNGMGAKARHIFSEEYAEVRRLTHDERFASHQWRRSIVWGIVLIVAIVAYIALLRIRI